MLVSTDYKAPNWLQKPFTWRMNEEYYDPQESEFATAVAATAFAINSIEEAEAEQKRRVKEMQEKSRANAKSKKYAEITRSSSAAGSCQWQLSLMRI